MNTTETEAKRRFPWLACLGIAALLFGRGNEDNQAGAGIVTDAGWTSKMEVEELPLAKLFVTILQRLGVETDSFGGQTGTLDRV
jgi:hypothetical protein